MTDAFSQPPFARAAGGSYAPPTTRVRGVGMVGEGWTNRSPVVRLSLASPALLLLVGPVWRRSVGHGIGLGATFGFALLVIAWTAYVSWCVAMNAHRRGGLYDETR